MRLPVFAVLALLLVGCSKQLTTDSVPVEGQAEREGALLAYEHELVFSTSPELLSERIAALRAACNEQRFGSCSVLNFEELSGDYPSATVAFRLAPEAVKPMVEFAGDGMKTNSSRTRAEDVSAVVGDIERERAELHAQAETLHSLQSRSDLKARDLIALSSEQAKVSARLAELERASAVIARRMETNLLTMRYTSMGATSAWSQITSSVLESGDALAEGVAEAVGMIAFGMPFVLVAFLLALLWRWAWRKVTR
ncbi:MAG: hypothetical protein BWZ07_01547 [Alphaproteobacteria bacterium ADurb.BinA280]|jgi:hypothetical protein|nr:DUF4349 domain-containing protein [Xanthomonadales bacterium]MCC6504715.1 DUF4349 domain-containing protein [Aquimonas sp.]OPZ12106.1 MAG: hypothetical protein BWZ07_01547 [Alphaproteobacteria bacterium ADurb.BinA280]